MKFHDKIEELDTEEIVFSEFINWEYFKNSTILVTGATGLIGYQIVTAILLANEKFNTNINILALIRNKEKAEKKFKDIKSSKLKFVVQDITEPLEISDKADYIIHTANGTSSRSFVEQPAETINSIVSGTKNILEYAKTVKVRSVVYLSSIEVYGTIDKAEPLKETDYGYINLQSLRSSYPEGKRLAENMCYCYSQEYDIPVKVARLCQVIGSGVPFDDNRVFAQFARSIVKKEDIILHTTGESVRDYCYVTDAISGIFVLLEKGDNGEIYNLANPETNCSIRQMAEMLCEKYSDSNIKIELNNKFYLPRFKLSLDVSKITSLGWKAKIGLIEMYDRLIERMQ